MAAASLPENPNLDQLRKRARDLQRRVRAGDRDTLARLHLDVADPAFRLTSAQRLVARHYGFASWTRLRGHVEAIAERTWTLPPAAPDAVDRFVRAACLVYDGTAVDPAAAAAVLREHPEIGSDLAVAAIRGDADTVRERLDDGVPANDGTGPFGWTPLMYAAYGRLDLDRDAVLEVVRTLLAAGADPDDGRYFRGFPVPFTVLAGVFGGGETGEPPHPHAVDVARLILAAGADPNDAQTLYNRMFDRDDDFLALLFEFGLGRGDGGPWRHRLPDLTASPRDMLRALLAWAVTHDQRERVTLLAGHGVDVVGPLPGGPGPLTGGSTPIETALRAGNRPMAELLLGLGAEAPSLDAVDMFVSAALAGDTVAVAATPAAVIEQARAARPGLIVWAAAQGRPAAVELVAGCGFDVDALGRGDVPVEDAWSTALHTAVEHDDAATVRVLLDLGADPTVRDRRFGATALDWARHLDRPHLVALLEAGADHPASG